eukprot:scaffold640762_cov63-Attheya_sp.AAC.1
MAESAATSELYDISLLLWKVSQFHGKSNKVQDWYIIIRCARCIGHIRGCWRVTRAYCDAPAAVADARHCEIEN